MLHIIKLLYFYLRDSKNINNTHKINILCIKKKISCKINFKKKKKKIIKLYVYKYTSTVRIILSWTMF